MDGHAELCRVSLHLWVVPPQESQQVAVFHIDLYLVEHCLGVAHKRDPFLPESAENTGEIICQIWSLE